MKDFETQRLAQIEKNQARLKELGLLETVKAINTSVAKAKQVSRQQSGTKKLAKPSRGFVRVEPARRSERVQGKEPTNYNEQALQKIGLEEEQLGRRPRLLRDRTSEVYTYEHVKLLGSSTKPWELFVDGYDANGERIYDKVNGQTCHQCRQKTLGKRTACSCCNSLRGVFCGDCLFMRYGENVDEVCANPEWVCPVCRDLCNCSFHRIKKGWAPTGTLYRAAMAEGFKSVAHYLVLTRLKAEDRSLAAGQFPEGYQFPDDEGQEGPILSGEILLSAQHSLPTPSREPVPAAAVCDQLLCLSPLLAGSDNSEMPFSNDDPGRATVEVPCTKRLRRINSGKQESIAAQHQPNAAALEALKKPLLRKARQSTLMETTCAQKKRAAEALNLLCNSNSKKRATSSGSGIGTGRGLRSTSRRAHATVA